MLASDSNVLSACLQQGHLVLDNQVSNKQSLRGFIRRVLDCAADERLERPAWLPDASIFVKRCPQRRW